MPQTILIATGPSNAGNFAQFSSAVNGEAAVTIRNVSNDCNFVFNVSNATDAAAELTANRVYLVPGSTMPVTIRCNPSTTWIRSNAAGTSAMYVMLNW